MDAALFLGIAGAVRNSVVIVAEIGGDLAGYMEVAGGVSAGTGQWLKW
jgi:hypothetical protein